jgi:hypothetical protein
MAFRYVKRTTTRAKKTTGFSLVPKGKKPPLGEGGRFAALKKAIAARGNVTNPGAVAAWIGRKKYGKARFQKMAAAGRKKKGKR